MVNYIPLFNDDFITNPWPKSDAISANFFYQKSPQGTQTEKFISYDSIAKIV